MVFLALLDEDNFQTYEVFIRPGRV